MICLMSMKVGTFGDGFAWQMVATLLLGRQSGRYLRLNGQLSLIGKLQASKRLFQNKVDKA